MAGTPNRNPEPRHRLGRGLAALLGEAPAEAVAQGEVQPTRRVPIEFLRANPRNPREYFDESELTELAASIQERGIIQPILVRPVQGVGDAYEIIAGERRWRAAQKAGQHDVPVIVLNIADREALELSIVENVQRADLNALEEARGYSRLASEFGHSQADLGRIVGKSRSHIANMLRLLGLPEHTQDLLRTGAISAGHARALLAVPEPDKIADRIVAQGLTVRDVERLGSKEKIASTEESAPADPNLERLARLISTALGVDATIKNTKRVHEVRISFADAEQLEYICNKLTS